MLFETVYGPELERVHAAIIALANRGPVDRAAVFACLIPRGAAGERKNVQDAISFLRSAGLLQGHDILSAIEARPFRLALLRQIRRIQLDASAPSLDRGYLQIVEDLFVRPNRVFRRDVHAAANTAHTLALTQERLAAWARVLEFIGLGHRIEGGFQCVYAPDLLREILAAHATDEEEIEVVLRDMVELYLPARTADGDAALAAWTPLSYLAEVGEIRLSRLQDSPARRYGPQGHTHLRVIRRPRSTGRRQRSGNLP